MFRYEHVNSTRKFTIVAEIVSLLKKIYKRDGPLRAVFKVKTLAVLFPLYPHEMKTNSAEFKSTAILALACFYGNDAIYLHARSIVRVWLKHAHSFDRCESDMQPWFTVYFFTIGDPCCDQLIPVKTRYLLTIITRPYRRLKSTTHRGHVSRPSRNGTLVTKYITLKLPIRTEKIIRQSTSGANIVRRIGR